MTQPTPQSSSDNQHTSFVASLIPLFVQRWRLLLLTALLGGGTGALVSVIAPEKWEAVTSISVGWVPADPLGRLTDKPVPLSPLEEVIDWMNAETTLHPYFDDEKKLHQTKVETHVLGPSLLRIVVKSPDKEDALRVAQALADAVQERHKERYEQWVRDTASMAERLRQEVSAVKAHLAQLPSTATAADSLALFAERRQLAELDRQAVVASMALNPVYARASSTVAPAAIQPRPRGLARIVPVFKTALTGSLLATLVTVLAFFVAAQIPGPRNSRG